MYANRVLLCSLGALCLGLSAGTAFAAGAGAVTHLSGTLSVVKPDGGVRILSQKSEVNPGDTLATEKDSYAQINFTDGSSVTVRPNSRLKLEAYNFVQERPQEDTSFFRLLRGGLRTVTGLVGKRGNQDAYKIGTSTATIGIRGSSGDTLVVDSDSATSAVQEGLYHTTYTGSYVVSNDAGQQIISEGQFGFVRNAGTAPQILPGDPGLNLKDLPFTLGVGSGPIRGSSSGECVVR